MLKRVAEVLCLGCLVLCGAKATAQSAVPIEQEPSHRVVLQNEHVRVFEVWLPRGEITLWHVHRHDGVSVRLAAATIEDHPKDGQIKTLRLRRGAVAYGATPTALTHRVRNVGESTFHNLYIELLPGHDGDGGRSAAAALGRQVELDNDRVRALRRILAPGESTAMHTHASSAIAVLVTAGRLEVSDPKGAARTVEVKAGAAQWIDSGTTHMLRNVGDSPVEIVDIELK
jgi:quercetin dioxygenase-like cupin family protein